jgi:two-component system, NtrC family, response regulator HydG
LASEKRVLLVDDDGDLLHLCTLALRGAGFVVDPVSTVATAAARLNGMKYDVVIADWRLPDGEGLTIADKAADLGAKTIIFSSYLFQIQAGTVLRHELLMKPMRPREFVAAVQRCMAGQPVDSNGL